MIRIKKGLRNNAEPELIRLFNHITIPTWVRQTFNPHLLNLHRSLRFLRPRLLLAMSALPRLLIGPGVLI